MYRVDIINDERMIAITAGRRFEWWGTVDWVGGTYIDVIEGEKAVDAIHTETRKLGPAGDFRAPFTEDVFRRNVDEWLRENT